jgi:hypothetical protein
LLGPATGLHHAAAPMTRRLGPAASAFHLVVFTGQDTLSLGPGAWRSPACQVCVDSSGRASCRSGSSNLRAPLRHRQCQLSGREDRSVAMKPLSFRLLQATTFWEPSGSQTELTVGMTGIYAEEAALYLVGDHEAARTSVATAIHVYCSTSASAWKFGAAVSSTAPGPASITAQAETTLAGSLCAGERQEPAE